MTTPTTRKITLHRAPQDGEACYAYYVDTTEGRVEITPDHDADRDGRITGWMTCLGDSGPMTMHRTLADVRTWIARGGR